MPIEIKPDAASTLFKGNLDLLLEMVLLVLLFTNNKTTQYENIYQKYGLPELCGFRQRSLG
jgi:hypothetical protein